MAVPKNAARNVSPVLDSAADKAQASVRRASPSGIIGVVMLQALDRVPLHLVLDVLNVGMPLPFRVLDAQDRLLLNAGQLLIDRAQVDALIERGAWAEKALVEATRAAAPAGRPPAAAPTSLFDRWERKLWEFDKLTRAIVRRQIKSGAICDFFESIQTMVCRDHDAALFVCVRQDDRRFALYALTHSLSCAVVSLLCAKQLRWAEEKIASLTCAALTMNLGIFELQAEMAEQRDPPSRKQIEAIRAHPAASAAMLRETGVTDESWLSTVTQHHEHVGGGGYPDGMAHVSESAQVLRAVDVLMAKISARANRPAIPPQTAIRELFEQGQGDLITP